MNREEQTDLTNELGWRHSNRSPEQVKEDSLSFRLCIDGLYASIKLHGVDPTRGMTKEEAEACLAKWFPSASDIEIEEH